MIDELITFRSIVAAVDGSEASRDALWWAGAVAGRWQSALTVLHVVDPAVADAARAESGEELASTQGVAAVQEFVAATWPDDSGGGAARTIDVRPGRAAEIILQSASEIGADLLVIGTRGVSGARSGTLGATAEKVLCDATTVVLAVPPAGSGSELRRSRRPPPNAGGVLIATSFADSAASSVAYGARLAAQLSVPSIFAHVVEPVRTVPPWRSWAEQVERTRLADARQPLTRAAVRHVGAGEYETVVSLGRPSDVIVSLAEERQSALIVIGLGDHGKPGARLGAVARGVLSATAVPTLLVPAGSAAPDVKSGRLEPSMRPR